MRREQIMDAIAYNNIRRLLMERALTFEASFDRSSFKGTAITFREWRNVLAYSARSKAADASSTG